MPTLIPFPCRLRARRHLEDVRREVLGALAVEALEVEDGLTPADRLAVAARHHAGRVLPLRPRRVRTNS